MPATQKKTTIGGTRKKRTSKTAAKEAKPKKGQSAREKTAGGRYTMDDLMARTEQVGSIFNKSLDLVETGIGLGINLITKLGSVAQEQIAEKISGRQNPAYGQTAAETERQYQGEPGHGGGEPSEQKGNFCVVNRLPLFPGSDVHIPFSINNDSPLSAKKLHLHVEGPGAEHFGMPFGSGLFSVRPDNVVIAPMDFEKLILTGTIPADAPSGSYSGWIVISGDEEFRIPATLTVTKK